MKKEVNVKKIAALIFTLSILLVVGTVCEASRVSQEKYKHLMLNGLARANAKLRSPNHPLEFGINLVFAHEAWVGGFPQEALLKAVEAIAELGAQRVDLNMGAYPWLDGDERIIRKYDAIVNLCRRLGLKVHINPQYSPIRHKFRSFNEWENAASSFYPVIAARYQPETFVVLHEPTTLADRLGVPVSPEQSADFVRRMAELVKKASPNTRIGAGALHNEQRYFQLFANLNAVDVLTFDIYSLKGLVNFNDMIGIARKAGKPVYIEETARPPYFAPKPGQSLDDKMMQHIGTATFEPIDAEWARTISAYASTHKMEGITFFWAHVLFTYVAEDGHADNPAYNRAVIRAVLDKKRTRTYGVIGELIRQYRRR